MPKYLPYLTTQRCIRLECGLTTRLVTPIDRCPRCQASMHTIEKPARELEELITVATREILAGFEALLRDREPAIDFRIRPNRPTQIGDQRC
jgi:hypothetical protein